jgi:hypothetical protein
MDWIGAQLLAYDPEKISLVRHAFDQFHWPIANSPSTRVELVGDLGKGSPRPILDPIRPRVSHPIGWRDAAADPLPGRPDSDDQLAEARSSSVEPQDA